MCSLPVRSLLQLNNLSFRDALLSDKHLCIIYLFITFFYFYSFIIEFEMLLDVSVIKMKIFGRLDYTLVRNVISSLRFVLSYSFLQSVFMNFSIIIVCF